MVGVAPEKPRPTGSLLRILGIAFGIAVTIGGMFGTGILRTPGTVAGLTGSVPLMFGLWLIGGLYAAAAAANIVELAVAIPKAGGYYVFVRRAFGEPAGFIVGWSDWLNQATGAASLAVAAGEYLAALFPALRAFVPAIASGVILIFGALHWQGTRMSSRVQQVASAVQASVFLALIAAAFAWGSPAAGEGPSAAREFGIVAAIALSFRSIVFAYDGWAGDIYFAEEHREPSRNMRQSMLTAVTLVTVVYLLMNAAYLYVLGFSRLSASQFPAADAASVLFGAKGGSFIQWLSLLALPAAINVILLSGTRILFAGARDGLFWRRAERINSAGTPHVALLITVGATAVFAATGAFEMLLGLMVVFALINYAATFGALFGLRKKEPQLPRPVCAWGYPWITGALLSIPVALLAALAYSDPNTALAAAFLVAISYPAYLVIRRVWA